MSAQLTSLLKSRISLIWLALIVATLISWRVGTDGGIHAHLATIVVLIVAFLKVRFVGAYFMELRDAPLGLRLAFEGYCVVVCATLIVMYLGAAGG
jgi:heme/copper-type cytochrome/quinol oxidase subunit 4